MQKSFQENQYEILQMAPYLGPKKGDQVIPPFSLNPEPIQNSSQVQPQQITCVKIGVQSKKIKKTDERKDFISQRIRQRKLKGKAQDFDDINDYDYTSQSDYDEIFEQ